MTEEQIGARFKAGQLCCDALERAVKRLLEERRRLLGALRDAERCGATSQTEDEIRAAIAFAEEAAPRII